MSRQDNIGCIDPHGMYPFPKDRESCPKCQAIRAQRVSPRRGLPYGWWKSLDFWVMVWAVLLISGVALYLGWAWFA